MTRFPAAPPAMAVRLLHTCLTPDDREHVIGDLTEAFADRQDAGRWGNRTWFWTEALIFAGAAITARVASLTPGRFKRMTMTSLTQGFRRLRHEWRFTASVVLILSVGIGPAAAMLSVVDKVLLRPLSYHDPDRLAMMRIDLGQLAGHPGLSPAEAIDMRASGLFESVESETRLNEMSLSVDDRLISLTQMAMTSGMLPMLGVQPILGRNFVEADIPSFARPAAGPPGPPPTPPLQRVLIDHALWQRQFGSDPGVIGRIITLNDGPYEIIGVLPDDFRLVTGRAVPQRVDVYTPFRLTENRNSWQYPTLARLRSGTTFAAIQSQLDTLSARIKKDHPDMYDGRLRYTITPALDDMTSTTRPALRAALVGVLLLLIIALANAAALVIARLKTRDLDFAIRSALGAGRGALVTEVMSEAALLGLGGAIAGSLLAVVCIARIREVMPRTVPRWDQIGVSWALIAYAAALAVSGLVALGLVPVWRMARGRAWNALRSGSVQGGRAEGTISRLILVGAQVALTVALAFGSAQLARSAFELNRVSLGFDPNVATFRVPPDFRKFGGPDQLPALYQRIRDRVRQVPGVTAVGVVTHLPLSGSTMMDGYTADLTKEVSFDQSANYQAVTPGYFESVRIPILQGRDFIDQEDLTQQPVIIVDETLARTAFPGEASVIGRTLKLGWGLPNSRIVGVVGHAKTIEVGRVVRPQIYAPIGNLFQSWGIVTVRAGSNPMAVADQVVAAINEVGPGRAVSNIAPLSDNVTAARSTLVAVTGLVAFLAISAGLLSAVGLYLVIAHIVYQRRRATAIRVALGAPHRELVWRHARTSVLVMAVAAPVGIVLSLALAPLFAGIEFGVSARSTSSLMLALAVAFVTGLLGTTLPVLRAGRANIVAILRGD
jgi:putative ABC transport system permease protein